MGENSTPEGSESPNSASPAGAEDETLIGGHRAPRGESGGPLARGATVGRYVVLETLGAGGMGIVYVAFDPQLDRRIALKVLRPEPGGSSSSSGGPARLLREAQAMARLNHPNVIAVHDVGTHDGEVFVAMEFVDGQTLTQWLADGPRPWREVLRVCRDAGRGLAAAHRAGIVHRDFKPDNVMLSRDERVYVLDFGLARPHTTAPSATSQEEKPDDTGEAEPPISIDTRLTQTGALLGTPAYMAPEQHTGDETSAKTDQFSFCVALYEGLYGRRPFRGESTASLAFNVLRGKVDDPPADARVPRWLRRVVVRGLSVAEEDRWPSMDALLAELSRDPAATRRKIFTGLGALALVGAGAYAYGAFSHDPTAICRGADQHLAGVWDDDTRDAAREAFEASDKPYAAESWRRVEAVLDGYAASWVSMHEDACEATRVRGEQSERMLDLRMSCLEDRRQQLAAVSKLFGNADVQTVQRAHQIAGGLPLVSPCGDIEQLNSGAEPPPLETRDPVEAVRAQLSEVAALVDAGKYEQALGLVRAAKTEASATDYAPVEAEATFWLGYLLEKNGDAEAAVEALSEAAFSAQAARHDAVAARAMTVLVFVVGDRLAKTDEALDWARHASASVSRLGDPLAQAELLNNEGSVLITAGRYAQAEAALEKSHALREQTLGPDHFVVGRTLNNLATALDQQGKYEQAREKYELALANAEAAVGPDHPDLGIRLTNFGEMLNRMGEHERAREYLERALTIFEGAVGKNHHFYASALNNLATVEVSEGKLERALLLMQETRAISEQLAGPASVDVALAELNIGSIASELGWHDEAKAHLEVALNLYEKNFGPDHPDVASVLGTLGTVLQETGDHRRALEHHRRAVAILQKHVEPDHPELANHRLGLGIDLLRLGQASEAVEPLELALASYQEAGNRPEQIGEIQFELAVARWTANDDRPRALELMKAAMESFTAAQRDEDAADARAWLDEHR